MTLDMERRKGIAQQKFGFPGDPGRNNDSNAQTSPRAALDKIRQIPGSCGAMAPSIVLCRRVSPPAPPAWTTKICRLNKCKRKLHRSVAHFWVFRPFGRYPN